MRSVLAGALGYLFMMHADLAPQRSVKAKRSLQATGALLHLSGIVGAARHDRELPVPPTASKLGWALGIAFGLLTIYSAQLEIPLQRRAHLEQGDEPVRTGFYALTRHPGVLWYALFLKGLTLATRSRLLLAATPAWVALDVAWVALEEQALLQRYPEYRDYQRETPMLLPTRRSLKAWLRSFEASSLRAIPL